MPNTVLLKRLDGQAKLKTLYLEGNQLAAQYENLLARLTVVKEEITASVIAADGTYEAQDVPNIRSLIAEHNDRITAAATLIAAL